MMSLPPPAHPTMIGNYRSLIGLDIITESDEETPGMILEFDENGNVVGIEILQASQHIDNPEGIEYSISPSVLASSKLT